MAWGGLTHGLESVGIKVELGVDSDPDCEYPYTRNNNSSFLLKSIADITVSDLAESFRGAPLKLLAGCAPCQPFSTYTQAKASQNDHRWGLLSHFTRLVQEVRPQLVTMENVPPLEREPVFSAFHATLEREGFEVTYKVINCADYGIPQTRKRLVLLASRLGSINILEPITPEKHHITVREAIGNLVPIEAGERCQSDPMHQACTAPSGIRNQEEHPLTQHGVQREYSGLLHDQREWSRLRGGNEFGET